jgi:hypothetical protein
MMASGLSEADRCPHCGGLTVLQESRTFRWMCGACGGPRVPGQAARSAAENAAVVPALREARTARSAQLVATGLALAAVIAAALAVSVGAVAFALSHVAGFVVFPFAILFSIFAVAARRRSLARHGEMIASLDTAWIAAAEAFARTRPTGATAEELAAALYVGLPDAEVLLTRLGAHDGVRIDVGDDASLRVRVATTAPEVAPPMDDVEEDARPARDARGP